MIDTDETQHPVAVPGGEMGVSRWHEAATGTPALLVHGVTANRRAWHWVAQATDRPLIAPDLRGRGESGTLPGGAGLAAHVTDLVAVLDRCEVDQALLVGHSMGAFVVAALAVAHPDRVAGILLADGGLPLPPPPPGMTPEQVLAATIGPAAARLEMTFADREAYLDYWRPHPALRDSWSPALEAYFDHDLVGTPPNCRSSVSLEAVRDDSADIMDPEAVTRRVESLTGPVAFLRAPSGLMAEPGGLYPPALIEEHRARFSQVRFAEAPGTNHYTLVMTPAGAGRVVEEMDALSPR